MDLRLPPELPLSLLLGLLFDRCVPPASQAPPSAPCQCQCACPGANGTGVSTAGPSLGPEPSLVLGVCLGLLWPRVAQRLLRAFRALQAAWAADQRRPNLAAASRSAPRLGSRDAAGGR